MMPAGMPRRLALALLVVLVAGVLAACGSRGNSVDDSAQIETGARLFAERCDGCHALDVVGAEGGALEINDRERVDGPNFNVRKELRDQVLYAIRNGGYSGAIMPENIVVGEEAEAVAVFLAKYSGRGENESTDLDTPGGAPGSQAPASQGQAP
jgi:mono/diheme cytochrome c family protein